MAEQKVKNLFQRILQVMSEVEMVVKEDKKVNGQYKFVTHDAVTKALHVPCVKAGIVIMPSIIDSIQDGNRIQIILETTFINADNPEEKHSIKSVGYGIDSQDKGPGKAFSYAFKMALLKAFMLESGEEDNELSMAEHKKTPVKLLESSEEKPKELSKTTSFRKKDTL